MAGSQRELPTVVGDDQRSSRRRLGQCLIDAGRLDASHVERACRLQQEQEHRERIGEILIKLGLVSERDVAEALAKRLGLPLASRQDLAAALPGDDRISSRFLRQHKVLVLEELNGHLSVAMADPENQYLIDALEMVTGKTIRPVVGVPAEIDLVLQQQDDANPTGGKSDAVDSVQFLDDVQQLKELASEAPVIKLVNQLIHRAVESGASDIHIEPFDGALKVRCRVDGLLRDLETPSQCSTAAISSRIKIMADLNIAERRLPQDGRFKMRVSGREIDLRVSTVPTMYGESVVLRLLHRDGVALDFGPLGFSPDIERRLLDTLSLPHGILLVTGPTGSGKSTTLYAALRHLNTPERKILTVEDPVEYNIDGVNQIQVKPQIGLTFSNALRHIVRQDPDVIMIGEMRDTETAAIAVQSALTGHLVLSTLHTNDAAGTITRLLDMAVEDYLLTSTVNAILAQRLVRTLCRHCRQSYLPMQEVVMRWGLHRFTGGAPVKLHRAVGCEHCSNSGYRGRSAVAELLPMSDAIRRLVLRHSDTSDIARAAAREGMQFMLDDGLRKAVSGETTIEEVLRVTQEHSRMSVAEQNTGHTEQVLGGKGAEHD